MGILPFLRGSDPGDRLDPDVAPSHRPCVVLLEKHGAGQPESGSAVREDARDIGPALDLLVDPLERVGGSDLGPVITGKRDMDNKIILGFEAKRGNLRTAALKPVRDETELGSGVFDGPRREGCGWRRRPCSGPLLKHGRARCA